VYEFPELINEARAEEGYAPVIWTELDSMEEYTLEDWTNSPGHRRTIMEDFNISMCAAECDRCWVITFGGSGIPGLPERESL